MSRFTGSRRACGDGALGGNLGGDGTKIPDGEEADRGREKEVF